MPWLAIATNKWTWITIAFGALASYAAVQHIGWSLTKAEYATFQAAVAKEAADAKVRNAQIAAGHAQAAQEVLDDLQTRYAALNARYASLRQSASPGGSPVPALSDPSATPGPSPAGQPDTAARCVAETLAVLEIGDRELAKYRELWELGQRNAQASP